MRRKLLYLPIAILTFTVTLFLTPYDPTAGLRGIISSVLSVTENLGPYNRVASEYKGSWGGPGGDVIALRGSYITDVEKGKSYQYRVISRFHYRGGDHNAYLIQVMGLEPDSNLRNYVYLGFDGNQMGYFGYDSLDNFDLGQASASGSFFKHRCFE